MVFRRIVQPGQRRKYGFKPGQSLLFRVSGTVIPLLWRMTLLSTLACTVACFVYDPLRRRSKFDPPHADALNADERLIFKIFADLEEVLRYFTGFVTFILGFFNATVFNRWWKMRELCGDLIEANNNIAMHICVYFDIAPEGDDGQEVLKKARRELIRRLALAQALALQACHRVRDLEWLVESKLLTRDGKEFLVLQKVAGPGYNEAYSWFLTAHKTYVATMCEAEHRGTVVYCNNMFVVGASNDAEDLMMHLNQPVPLAYSHLLEVMVTIYVLITPLALVPSLLWVAIFVAPLVTLFFYGFYLLGTNMLMDPFQKDSGFDTTGFLTSTILAMESLEQNVPLPDVVSTSPLTSSFDPQRSIGRDKTRRRRTAPGTPNLAEAFNTPPNLAEAFKEEISKKDK